MHGELLSYVFFAGEFAEALILIQLGQTDAQRWIDEHPAHRWQLDPLPAWNQPPTATETLSAPTPIASTCDHGRKRTPHRPSPGKQRRRLSNAPAPAAADTCQLPSSVPTLREAGLPTALAPGRQLSKPPAPPPALQPPSGGSANPTLILATTRVDRIVPRRPVDRRQRHVPLQSRQKPRACSRVIHIIDLEEGADARRRHHDGRRLGDVRL
jgi:hypothetical protein